MKGGFMFLIGESNWEFLGREVVGLAITLFVCVMFITLIGMVLQIWEKYKGRKDDNDKKD